MKYTVQIVGVGGQGVLLASMVLGNAAMEMGYKVAMSEVHGMAQRGGSVLCTLRFGDDVISPLEAKGGADLIMGFEPVETCRNMSLGNKDTKILMNLDPVYPAMVAAGMDEYPEIDDLIKKLEAEKDMIDQKIKLEMEDAAYATAEGYRISWVSAETQRLDTKRLKEEEPDLYDRYCARSSFRRFSIKPAA